MIDVVGVILSRVTAARAAFLDAAVSSLAAAATALSTATWTNGLAANLDNLDVTISSRLGTLKSVQYGTATIANGATSGTATITAVTLAKAIILFLGQDTNTTNTGVRPEADAKIVLTNTTTVTASRSATNVAGDDVVSFVVVEWN